MNKISDQIQKNNFKTSLILAIFASTVGGILYLIFQQVGAGNSSFVLSISISLAMALASFYYGPNLILTFHQAKKLSPHEYPEYQRIVRIVAQSANLPTPAIYIIHSSAPNAFATGRDPSHGVVCVTTGLLNTLNSEELAAVVAHEIAHIKNYDIRLMAVVSVLVGSLSSAIHYLQYSSLFGSQTRERERNPAFELLSFLLIIFAPITATLIQLAISRQREFLADATSAGLTHKPQSLISALEKIHGSHKTFSQAQLATATLYIHNPFSGNKFLELFSTHPSLEQRIAALKKLI